MSYLDKIEIMNFLELFKKPNLIAAHRGDSSQKPENTLSALASSIGKCDFVEIDVQLTKDLIPVIIHNNTLGRTSKIPTAALQAYKHPSDLIYYLHTLKVDAYHPQDNITNNQAI